ncbi:protein kinase [Histoplasma capsulatum G186AR]|uniref:non-specific serine/threonine protein kinase n=2 Tax=Ajellomyces capsulatus TaxID=5037 RepID=C0NXE9_AJECG|nr:protein kinase [Histoplasma capsulatum G186AR]EEH04015.1 protein kinase [Histoplasma capsulatum G186AR]
MDKVPATSETSPKYKYIGNCERLERYCPGGFCPINLGDHLCDGRYTIIHNLGFGGSSTVWLASDHKQRKLVAIKIKTADSASSPSESQEVDFLKRLHSHRLIRKLLDSFVENSPNGAHDCLVMEPASCSLMHSKSLAAHALLELRLARAVAADLVLTVQFLHSQGIIHGDIHSGNIFLRLPTDVRRITDPSQLYQKFGDPILEPIVRVDGKPLLAGVPNHIVRPARIGIRSDKITPPHLPITLSDFSSSYYPSKTRRTNAHTLPHLVPPETYFLDSQREDDILSFPSEIWTLGCTIFEIMGSWGPFSTLGGGILQDQVGVLGPLPDPWWAQWESRAEFYNEDATIDMTTGAPFHDSLEERYDWFVNVARRRCDMEAPGEEEKKAFLHMLGMMFRYLPGDRATIQDVVGSEWMRKWALPAKREVEGLR